jgi:hypothetical protein
MYAMDTQKKRPRIEGNLTQETYARYEQMKHRLGFTTKGKPRSNQKGEGNDERCIRTLLDAFETNQKTVVEVTPANILDLLKCSASELNEITEALELDYIDFWTMLRNGFLREVRINNTQAQKLKAIDLNDTSDRATNRIRGSAYVRVKQCVDMLMQANLDAKHPMDIVYITRGIVQDATKTHSDYVTEYFKQHEAELEAHHRDMGISSHTAGIRHNRLRARHVRDQRSKNGTLPDMVVEKCE